MKNNTIYWFFILSIIIFIFDYFGFLSSFKNPAEIFTMSVKEKVFALKSGINNFGSILMQYQNIKKAFEEREKLQKKIAEMEISLEALNEENQKLRKQLGAPLPSSYQFIPAIVAGVVETMEISLGDESGIKAGMTVVDEATLIGKIIKTSRYRSTVILPWDTQINIPAKTSRGAKGMVVGQAGGKIILDKVLQKEPLFLDDLVITSGEGDFPPNLLIGKITHIITDDISVYKTAQILPAVDYHKERLVFVISSL